jgi:LmbE family N-acetylglucosaminyl deacetylase
MENKDTILCIFAHPDDESFGPGGTIAKLAKTNNVHLICVTDGNDPGKVEDLRSIRKKELLKASKILGVKKNYFFNYRDGTLNNLKYHEIAEKISSVINRIDPKILITYEQRGVSGHLDHIAVSMISTYVFERYESIRELWYFCISKKERDMISDYFIYFPTGLKEDNIDLIIDVSEVWDIKLSAIKAHKSQIKDAKEIIKLLSYLPKKECFLIRTK